MSEKKVEIFYGDVRAVRNELNEYMKHVNEVISMTQSVTASLHHSTAMLTVVLVYTEYIPCPEEFKYVPIEQYL